MYYMESMLVNILTGFSGALIFLFLFWKKLKDDYSSEIIFKSAFSIIIGVLISWGLSLKFLPDTYLWLSALGAMGGAGLCKCSFQNKIL